jgi:hypothetical protein
MNRARTLWHALFARRGALWAGHSCRRQVFHSQCSLESEHGTLREAAEKGQNPLAHARGSERSLRVGSCLRSRDRKGVGGCHQSGEYCHTTGTGRDSRLSQATDSYGRITARRSRVIDRFIRLGFSLGGLFAAIALATAPATEKKLSSCFTLHSFFSCLFLYGYVAVQEVPTLSCCILNQQLGAKMEIPAWGQRGKS